MRARIPLYVREKSALMWDNGGTTKDGPGSVGASEDGTGRGTPIIAPTLLAGGNETGGTRPPGTTVDTAESLIPTATTVRRLTPLECERLQGFPDGWTATSNGKPQADSARYRQMGNAVAVPCVEWIARRIVQADEREVSA